MNVALIAGRLVRLAAVCGLAIFLSVLLVSPTGLAAAVTFLAPVFVPALVGVVIGLVGSRTRTWRGRQVAASALMIPGFLLATYLAVNYSYSRNASDAPAVHGKAAAQIIEVIGPVGALVAIAGLTTALVHRRSGPARGWPVVIGVADLLMVVIGLSAARRG